jgi:drug/metabolite transporter (DMT)-like permease
MSLLSSGDKQYDRLYQAVLFAVLALIAPFGVVGAIINSDKPTGTRVAAGLGCVVAALVFGGIAFVLLRRWWRNRPGQPTPSN